METTIFRTLKGSIMEKIFDENFNIRYYKRVNDADDYNSDYKYKFKIKIRHNEDVNPRKLFDNLLNPKKKRLFIILTEKKRVRNRISFYIGEIINGSLKLIDNTFQCSKTSNKGLNNEAVNHLVNLDVLPQNKINASGYIDSTQNYDYNLLTIESQDLAYINFV